MKISIDTNTDSHEDIRKVIALLSSMTDKNYSRIKKSKNIFEDDKESEESSESGANAFLSMFGSSGNQSSSESKAAETEVEGAEAASGDEEVADEKIQVIPY